MSRSKKEEISKHQEARKGLSLEQIKTLDIQEAKKKSAQDLVRKIQAEKFPGEDINQMSDEVKELCIRIDEIMFYKWDPIHLSNSNWPRDEYESYVPEVIRLTLESKSYHPIADYLTHVSTEIIGMTENRKHDIEIAKLIFSLAENETNFPDHTIMEVE